MSARLPPAAAAIAFAVAAMKVVAEVDLELVRKLYGIVTPDAVAKGCPYRKENPLHRLYYHEIAAPEKIVVKMKKLQEWMESDDFRDVLADGTKIRLRRTAVRAGEPIELFAARAGGGMRVEGALRAALARRR